MFIPNLSSVAIVIPLCTSRDKAVGKKNINWRKKWKKALGALCWGPCRDWWNVVFSEAVHCALIVLCEVAVFSLLLQCFFLWLCVYWMAIVWTGGRNGVPLHVFSHMGRTLSAGWDRNGPRLIIFLAQYRLKQQKTNHQWQYSALSLLN